MPTWLEELLSRPRPGFVTWAAILSVLGGGVTLAATGIIGIVLFDPTGSGWMVIVVGLVAVAQVTGAVLLIVGGTRLALGAGRTGLVVGASLHFLVCGAYLLHAQTVVAGNSTEPPGTVAFFTVLSFLFAVLPAGGLFLALHRETTEYLTLCGAR
jgi:hypothetical protein